MDKNLIECDGQTDGRVCPSVAVTTLRRSTRIWATLHTQVERRGEPKSEGAMGSSRLESTLEETKTEDLERCAGKLF
jgi:hypothetical protein